MAEAARPIVLVVDDDPSIRESLRFLFEEAAYEVEEADDGAAALELLRAQARPRVMLLDRMMSRMDGVQTLRQLASEPPETLQRTMILFMSARSDSPSPEINDLIQRYTAGTVTKPFHLDDLLAVVQHASERLTQRLTFE